MHRLGAFIRPLSRRNRTDLPLLSVVRERGVVLREADDGNHNVVPEDLSNYKVVHSGDLVINKMKAWQGSLGVASQDGIVSPAYYVYRLDAAEPRYAHALLRSPPYVGALAAASQGVRVDQWDLSTVGLRGLPLLVPPPEDQASVVRYLDHIDSRIQRFIAAKERLIELLEEEKRAIIHRAVTRGLDPDAPLKLSGVDAIGKIPSHWGVLPFKRVLGFREGPGIGASDFRDEGVPLLRIAGMKGAKASLAGCNYLDQRQVDERWSQFRIELHDYLLSASASAGEVVPASPDVVGAIPYTGIIRLWLISSSAHMPFVAHFLRSRPFRAQVEVMASGVAIQHFGPTHLKRTWIALPPIEEQQKIVDALDSQLGGYEVAVTAARRQTELVREYRTRLISDVVTGKVDVCDTARRLPSDPAGDVPELDEELEEAVA